MPNLLKSQLMREIHQIFLIRKMTQREFAKILNTKQNKISRICRGHLQDFSLEILIKYLNILDRDVQMKIIIKAI